MMKTIKQLGITLLVALLMLPATLVITSMIYTPTAYADFLPVQVYPTDTVAGYPSALRTSLIDPYKDVRFVVETPEGAVVQIPAQADAAGIASADFYGHQTKVIGTYKVAMVYPGSSESSPQSSFTVYPDQISTTQSTLRSTLQMLEASMEETFLVVTLYDQYRNPISDHRVNLISSRSEDTIETLAGGVTDQNGRANFRVTSAYPGISTYTAMDVTVNEVLQDREEVVYTTPSQPVASASVFTASLLSAEIGQGDTQVLAGPVDRFDIQGLASTVEVNDELSVTVVARDANGNVAKNYTGTVSFGTFDENAILPGNHTFDASDQGQFTFDLALSFSQAGNQVLQVFDANNFQIMGEFSLEVIPVGGVITGPVATNLEIKSPTDGSELGTNLIILTGTGDPNINLTVFDNDVKIGDSGTDSDGFFSHQVKNLDSGTHTFYVMNESREVSNAVTITIDTLSPVLNLFEIFPEGTVLPGEQVEITVQSEPRLEEAKIRLQGIEEPMQESDSEPGTYRITVVAPANDGTFPIDIILIDSLSNRGEFAGRGTIQVNTPAPNAPPVVQIVEATPGDSVIELVWEEVLGHDRPIDHYRVYYGTVLSNLDTVTDTNDDSTTWELRGLTNDTQYFMAIKAVDTQGIESENLSVLIAATPVAPDPCDAIECGEFGICADAICHCSNGYSGELCEDPPEPEPIVLPEPDIEGGQLMASSVEGGLLLSWAPFSGVQAYHYKVFIGVSPGNYTDFLITPNNATTTVVMDLINGVTYYFAVVALDINGNIISRLSREFQFTPSGAGFHPAAPSPVPYDTELLSDQLGRVPKSEDTGPEAIWIILGSLLFASVLYRHKKKILSAKN